MELQDYLLIVRKRWRIIAFVVLTSVMLSTVATLASTKLYESTTQFFVSTTGSEDSGALLQGSTFTQQRVKSYTQLLTTPRILDPVAQEVGGSRRRHRPAGLGHDPARHRPHRGGGPRRGSGARPRHRHGHRERVPRRGVRAGEPRGRQGQPDQGDRRAVPHGSGLAGQPQAGAQRRPRRGARPAPRSRGGGPARDARQGDQVPRGPQAGHRGADPGPHRPRPGRPRRGRSSSRSTRARPARRRSEHSAPTCSSSTPRTTPGRSSSPPRSRARARARSPRTWR